MPLFHSLAQPLNGFTGKTLMLLKPHQMKMKIGIPLTLTLSHQGAREKNK